MAKRPLIGVTSAVTGTATMRFFTMLGVRLAGGKPVSLTAKDSKKGTHCDGYVICGGSDIDPVLYGQQNRASIGIDRERDKLEQFIIVNALEKKKPLLGICRGAQMINVVRGGTLEQNAQDFYENFVPADSVIGKIFYRKKVSILKRGILSSLLKEGSEIYANSLHHQAISQLGQGLKIVAKDEIDIVQAIESEGGNDSWILGVQWHPEFMLYSWRQRRLFKGLVQACKKH